MQLFRFVRFVILKMYTVVMASKFVFWSVGHVFEYCSRWFFFFFLPFTWTAMPTQLTNVYQIVTGLVARGGQ